MKQVIISAASTAVLVVTSLLSLVTSPQQLAPAVIVLSVPSSLLAKTEPIPDEPVQKAQEVVTSYTTDQIEDKITFYASKYKVNRGLMRFTVGCESGGDLDPKVQSKHTYPVDHPEWGVKAGDRELSFGLAQIHLPSNPGIKQSQAEDADFSLDFLARGLAAGEFWRWSCLVK